MGFTCWICHRYGRSLVCCRLQHRMDFQQGLITTVHDYGLGNLDAFAFRKELAQANGTADSMPDGRVQSTCSGTIRDALKGSQKVSAVWDRTLRRDGGRRRCSRTFFNGMPFRSRFTGPTVPRTEVLRLFRIWDWRQGHQGRAGPSGRVSGGPQSCRGGGTVRRRHPHIRILLSRTHAATLLDPSHGVAMSRRSTAASRNTGIARTSNTSLRRSCLQAWNNRPLPYLRYLMFLIHWPGSLPSQPTWR